MYLDKQTFTTIIDSTPLVSIDLLVENSQGQILLGLRNNRPAQGFWFVPGGRILKNESLKQAFSRLCSEELGIEASLESAKSIGIYEHFYSDSVFGDEISTHYVVLAFKISVEQEFATLPKQQHSDYAWFKPNEALIDESVHTHTKWYLTSTSESV
ncbi:TPA: GDP-mannose mannosyl hydrolase [Vibrio parahaemolyticus]|nr:GDP-mannose mannosyl hydrolase [Vibrio parahaemolyticus]